MKDIAPELLERIEKDFERVFSSDSTIKALYRKTKDGTATYEDAQKFAVRTGRLLADVFRRNLSSEILPDGRLYYNIASRILNSTLGNNHSLISGFAADVQYYANSKAGVGIKVQPAQLDQERIDGIVNIVSGKHRYDDIAYMLDEPVITFGQAVVDDFLKRNIDFQGKSGLSPRVVRRTTGKPCPWCEAVAGSYTYPDVPHDVYRRHQRCRCIVEYEPGNGRRQNVHSKEWIDAAELEKRKNIGLETPLKKDPDEITKNIDSDRTYRYNNFPAEKLRDIYDRSVAAGRMSPLIGFSEYYKMYNELQDSIVGRHTINGILIRSQSNHFMERVIGTAVDPKIYEQQHIKVHRDGVSLDDIRDALFNGTARRVLVNDGGKTQVFTGKNCRVSINPETGKLIQCNPIKKVRK